MSKFDGNDAAVKYFGPIDKLSVLNRRRIEIESAILQKISHPNIMKFYGISMEDGKRHY